MPQRETVAGEATAKSWTSNIIVMLWKFQKKKKGESKDLSAYLGEAAVSLVVAGSPFEQCVQHCRGLASTGILLRHQFLNKSIMCIKWKVKGK